MSTPAACPGYPLGKTQRAARAMSQNFARRRVRKRYLALVAGVPDPPQGEIALAIVEGSFHSDASPEGKEARTRYRVLEAFGSHVLVEVEPLTGRMHQIRVHLAAIGHPVLGDARYGQSISLDRSRELPATRLFLHASRLEFPHPEGGKDFVIESPLPEEFGVRSSPFR